MTTVPRWLPNAVSLLRVLLVPVWLWLAERCQDAFARGDGDAADTARLWAAVTLVAIGLSDVVDGYLARRFHLASSFGAMIDAVADKLCQVVLVTWFTVRMQLVDAPAFRAVAVVVPGAAGGT